MTRHEPMYIRIRNHILEGITSGRFRPGDRLPSELELAAQFSTTRSTVVHGLQSLVAEARITREIGRGTFVSAPARRIVHDANRVTQFEDQITAQGGRIGYRLLSFARMGVPARVAGQLGLAEEEEVYQLRRIRLVDDLPTVEETRYLPLDLAQSMSIDALSRMPMYQILAEVAGRPVAQIRGVIRADAATEGIARDLGIPTGTPVLVRDYVLIDAVGVAMVSGEATFRKEVEIAYAVGGEGTGAGLTPEEG